MTDPTDRTGALGPGAGDPDSDLALVVAGIVLSTPGVLRLEPTLSNALRRLIPARLAATTPNQTFAGADGVVVRHRDGSTDVTVDVAVSAPPSAVAVALDVETRIRAALGPRGLSRLAVAVNVLSSEPAQR